MFALAVWSYVNEDVKEFIDRFSPIAAVITSLLTFLYVFYTVRMVNLMVESSMEESRPYVVVDIQPDSESSVFEIVITNIGKSPAINVSVNFSPDIVDTEMRNISELLFKEPIPFIPPSHRIKTVIDSTHEIFGDERIPKLYNVNVSYWRMDGKKHYNHDYVINLEIYRNVAYIKGWVCMI
jgi:hypothetical protein